MAPNTQNYLDRFGFARTFSINTRGDWLRYEFSLDSVRVQGDSASFVGHEEDEYIYIGFCWRTDNNAVARGDDGAFIDDLTVSVDDGRIDLFPVRMLFGYPQEFPWDTIRWTDEPPRVHDQVYLRLDWRKFGESGSPEFTVQCKVDNIEFFSENRHMVRGEDSIYVSVTDELWIVTEGIHSIQWELDAPEDDQDVIDESDEDNNSVELTHEFIWDPPPVITLLSPLEDFELPINHLDHHINFQIEFSLYDSSESDQFFYAYINLTQDTTGISADPERFWDYANIWFGDNLSRGDTSFSIDWVELYNDDIFQLETEYFLVFFAGDQNVDNRVIAVFPGKITLLPFLGVKVAQVTTPADFRVGSLYPNPFNLTTRISFSNPIGNFISFDVFDLNGKQIEQSDHKFFPAGSHNIDWQPSGIPAGVYIIRITGGNLIIHAKAVFMP